MSPCVLLRVLWLDEKVIGNAASPSQLAQSLAYASPAQHWMLSANIRPSGCSCFFQVHAAKRAMSENLRGSSGFSHSSKGIRHNLKSLC